MSGPTPKPPKKPAPKKSAPNQSAANKPGGKPAGKPGQRPPKKPLGAREIALEALTAVEQEGAYSNLALNAALTRHKPEPREAGLATELVYGTIQRLQTIDAVLGAHLAKGVSKLQPWVRSLLRLSAYQLLYLDRVPAHAAVSEAVSIARRRGHAGVSGLVNAVLRKLAANPGRPAAPAGLDDAARIAFEESHPEWLIREWVRAFGAERAGRIAAANNEPPKASVRVNRLKLTRAELIERLAASGVAAEPSAVSYDGVVVTSGGNAAHGDAYAQGLCTVQDESSMLVAALVDPEPGMRVLDCCAAPGGKSTHLAERMEDEGEIIACDIHPHKRELIDAAARRLGLRSVETVVIDAAKLHERFEAGSFDRVLLDAPCSGFGVIRRKPDIKWTKTRGDVDAIAETQKAILRSAAKLVKPGGALVYSTCTLEPKENEEQIAAFLAEHPEFAPDPRLPSGIPPKVAEACAAGPGMLRVTPEQFGSDGFFMARLVRSPHAAP
ncbi:16S rRNA (cytosine(967)-C(5))-methyltransferase RsmB [Paenibacillus sp.]|uniref:16S rRNA (cytosine(967)-C(5))-methyltransferase RsmB n=1 Tax=Paenibacillus sp. TaxID=58172 RepID=UPI002D45505C|nr:16S rRNA (cytosine(967)-C(5))-methyltransferase RsmB [Paenibacillus sp.]HZG84475.1 16S rRNA (cytosine(967)-C(5))-methyltransferase RsmB [Paenibacillus sp.]